MTNTTLAIPPTMYDHQDISNHLRDVPNTFVREQNYGLAHVTYEGAPCGWSAERGATHTLWLGIGLFRGARPAILKKSVLYVGLYEEDDQIVWDKWSIKHIR